MSLASISVLFTGTVFLIALLYLMLSYIISRKRSAAAFTGDSINKIQTQPITFNTAPSARPSPELYKIDHPSDRVKIHSVEMPRPVYRNKSEYPKPGRLEVINAAYIANGFSRDYYRT